MESSLTGNGQTGRRTLLFVSGLGMIVASILTVRHFFMANYPQSIFQGSFCDINAFFNCDSSAFSSISQIHGVPLGYFGLVVGVLVALCAVFPSPAFERTNKTISALNAAGVIINNRMIIGTLPYVQLRAIFQALADRREQGGKKGFIEQWVPTRP